jgi:nucleoside-diphosphate-sugar epimerase
MRVFVTGCNGYIGSVLMPLLAAEGHDAFGVDNNWFEPCTLGGAPAPAPHRVQDIRELQLGDLEGYYAVIHLAALSNDPLSNLDPQLTYEINHQATVRLARLAKQAGVERFLVSSSCSTYGLAGDELVTEEAELNPVTPYGRSKVLADREVSLLADDDFSPTFLRNATAYGASPRLRLDLVLNDFVAAAYATGRILMLSDGTPWRPLVHVEDICRAFLAVLEARREAVHDQAFNVGSSSENYRVSELAAIVQETVGGCRIEYADGAGPDQRCYRVDCGKISRRLPDFQLRWNARLGARQLLESYRAAGLSADDLAGPRFYRLRTLRRLIDGRRLTGDLRWREAPVAAPADASALTS